MSGTMSTVALVTAVLGILLIVFGMYRRLSGSPKNQAEIYIVYGLVSLVIAGLMVIMFGGLSSLPSLPLHFVSANTSGGGHNALVNKTESITLDDLEIVIKFLIALLFSILAGWVQISDLPWKNFKRTVILLFLTASLGSLIWILFPAP